MPVGGESSAAAQTVGATRPDLVDDTHFAEDPITVEATSTVDAPQNPEKVPDHKPLQFRSFCYRYLFLTKSALVAYVTFGVVLILALASETMRDNLENVRPGAMSVAALGLTFVLASMSFLSGMLQPGIVRLLDTLRSIHGVERGLVGILMTFRATAGIAAAAILSWLTLAGVQGLRLAGYGWMLRSVIGSLALALTVWLVLGLLRLIKITSVMLRDKASSVRHWPDPDQG